MEGDQSRRVPAVEGEDISQGSNVRLQPKEQCGTNTDNLAETAASFSGTGDSISSSSSSGSSSSSSSSRKSQHHVLSIAPMIQWTDRHYRHIMRSLTKKTKLFTEMVMDDAIYFNRQNLEPFIGFDRDLEPPIALQIGGCTPELCGEAARLGEEYGYTEINLNAGSFISIFHPFSYISFIFLTSIYRYLHANNRIDQVVLVRKLNVRVLVRN